jgi:hypothetical protein
MASSIQPILGDDFAPKLTSNSKETFTGDATTIDTLYRKEEERKSRLEEQCAKARLLVWAWLYKNSGSSKRNRRKLRVALLRLKPLGLTLGDVESVINTVLNHGQDSGEAFCVAREVAECLLYPVEWAVYDAETIKILSHLFTDLLGCVSVQEVLEKPYQLGWKVVDGSMGLPTYGLKQAKLLHKYMATKPLDDCEISSSLEQVAEASEEKH